MLDRKTCSQCAETKPYAQFAKLREAKDGHRAYCKTCGQKYYNLHTARHGVDRTALTMKHLQWREANREHIRKYQREYQREYRSKRRAERDAVADR